MTSLTLIAFTMIAIGYIGSTFAEGGWSTGREIPEAVTWWETGFTLLFLCGAVLALVSLIVCIFGEPS